MDGRVSKTQNSLKWDGSFALQYILDDIDLALKSKLYFVALAVSLTLPGICAALSQVSGDTNGPGMDRKLYCGWFDEFFAKRFSYMSGEDCYGLRCGVIHQGKSGHKNKGFKRVVFFLPDSPIKANGAIMDEVLMLEVEIFCRNMVSSVESWLHSQKNNLTVRRNLPDVVQYRPNGFERLVGGIPVIT